MLTKWRQLPLYRSLNSWKLMVTQRKAMKATVGRLFQSVQSRLLGEAVLVWKRNTGVDLPISEPQYTSALAATGAGEAALLEVCSPVHAHTHKTQVHPCRLATWNNVLVCVGLSRFVVLAERTSATLHPCCERCTPCSPTSTMQN